MIACHRCRASFSERRASDDLSAARQTSARRVVCGHLRAGRRRLLVERGAPELEVLRVRAISSLLLLRECALAVIDASLSLRAFSAAFITSAALVFVMELLRCCCRVKSLLALHHALNVVCDEILRNTDRRLQAMHVVLLSETDHVQISALVARDRGQKIRGALDVRVGRIAACASRAVRRRARREMKGSTARPARETCRDGALLFMCVSSVQCR